MILTVERSRWARVHSAPPEAGRQSASTDEKRTLLLIFLEPHLLIKLKQGAKMSFKPLSDVRIGFQDLPGLAKQD